MPQSIESILKKAKPRETTAVVYMAGDLVAELERLERQLAEAGDQTWAEPSLAAADPSRDIAQKIAAVRKRLKASEVEFRFRALPDKEWSDLLAAHAPRNDTEMFNAETLPRELIAACAVDPEMAPEQVDQLYAVLNQAQRNTVFDAAFSANTEASSIPFSVSASAILGALGDGK